MALWQLRFFMNYASRPEKEWTLTLELENSLEIDGEWNPLVNTFAGGLANVLLETVNITKAVLSTWEKDGDIYDPDNTRTFPLSEQGLVQFSSTTPVDDDIVSFVRKSVDSGRSGKMFTRGTLVLSDLQVTTGSWVINPAKLAEIEARWDTFFDAIEARGGTVLIGVPLIETIYPATPEGTKQVPIKVYGDIPTVRQVNAFVFVKPNERQDTQ